MDSSETRLTFTETAVVIIHDCLSTSLSNASMFAVVNAVENRPDCACATSRLILMMWLASEAV